MSPRIEFVISLGVVVCVGVGAYLQWGPGAGISMTGMLLWIDLMVEKHRL